MKKYNLMTAEEYSKMKCTYPYIFEIEKGKKHLLYFGSEHVFDPNHPSIQEIRDNFFKTKPQMTFVEGFSYINNRNKEQILAKLRELDGDKLVENGGEPHFTVQLALLNGSKVKSPEPDFNSEINALFENGFSKEDIFLFYILRRIGTVMLTKLDLKFKILEVIDYLETTLKWEGFKFTYDNFIELHKKNFNQELSKDVHFYRRLIDPIARKGIPQTVFNRIAEFLREYRDQNIVNEIENGLSQYDRIFIVYGGSHAYMQEKAIREIFDNLK